MIFHFHPADLEPGLPRVLPYPLSCQARYRHPDEMPEDLRAFLLSEGANPDIERGRWVVRIWDERIPDDQVATAVICWEDGKPVTEAIWAMTPYHPMNLLDYIEGVGHRLWETGEVTSD